MKTYANKNLKSRINQAKRFSQSETIYSNLVDSSKLLAKTSIWMTFQFFLTTQRNNINITMEMMSNIHTSSNDNHIAQTQSIHKTSISTIAIKQSTNSTLRNMTLF